MYSDGSPQSLLSTSLVSPRWQFGVNAHNTLFTGIGCSGNVQSNIPMDSPGVSFTNCPDSPRMPRHSLLPNTKSKHFNMPHMGSKSHDGEYCIFVIGVARL
ncbi:unnamed protein product [Phytophthora fragariaefolia]|uniref:Unnamed protein product n=1 Tax=Phytophthora fragariaefolia TaxID=1490495 RepID=A0A9W6XIL7_9STRA|nr:unnamed protein product [Phytophthora fragariaefolia]